MKRLSFLHICFGIGSMATVAIAVFVYMMLFVWSGEDVSRWVRQQDTPILIINDLPHEVMYDLVYSNKSGTDQVEQRKVASGTSVQWPKGTTCVVFYDEGKERAVRIPPGPAEMTKGMVSALRSGQAPNYPDVPVTMRTYRLSTLDQPCLE